MRRLIAGLVLLAAAAALGGCDTVKDWFSSDKKVVLKGERVPILLGDQTLKPDPRIQDLDVALPTPRANREWPTSGGNPAHDMQSLALASTLHQAWSSSIGAGKSKSAKHLAVPVMAEGVLYAMDTSATVVALNAESGARQWQTDLTPEGDVGDGDLGGGLAYADGRLYVTDNYGETLALDAKSGKILWRKALGGPTRAAPTVGGGRVFVTTVDNQLHALSAKDGTVQWTHSGLAQVTGLLGAASPAYEAGIVLVPYSSGELYALRADNGRVVWQETLASVRPSDSVASLVDIRGNPVIDRDRVIAIGHSGRMEAIDLRSGGRVWDISVGGLSMPWVAGNFVFVMSSENQLVCLTRDEGRVRWVTPLDRWTNLEKKSGPVLWSGPVLAGNLILIASTDQRLLAVAPETGEILASLDVGESVSVAPIVAGGTLYVLTDAGDIKAYR